MIGNDQTFKSYTKNHQYESVKYIESRKKQIQLEQSVLSVHLKDLETPTQKQDILALDEEGMEEESKDARREQYRVIKKDLLFVVNFRQSKYYTSAEKSV